MTRTETLTLLAEMKSNITNDLLTSAFVMIYYDHETDNLIAYDATDVFRCHASVEKTHPSYEFVFMYPCPSSASAREIAKSFSIVAKVRPSALLKLNPDFLLEVKKAYQLKVSVQNETPMLEKAA